MNATKGAVAGWNWAAEAGKGEVLMSDSQYSTHVGLRVGRTRERGGQEKKRREVASPSTERRGMIIDVGVVSTRWTCGGLGGQPSFGGNQKKKGKLIGKINLEN